MTNRSRNIRISVRLNQKEHQKLKEKCQITGLPIEGLVRQLLDDCNVRARPPESYIDLVREIAAVGNNINQITHLANSIGYVNKEQIERIEERLEQIWELVQEEL